MGCSRMESCKEQNSLADLVVVWVVVVFPIPEMVEAKEVGEGRRFSLMMGR